MSTEEYTELISIALKKRVSWIYCGPLDAARTKKINYSSANELVVLEKLGLITLKRNSKTYTVHLTKKGIRAVISMPTDLGNHWFPLSSDIAEAKNKLLTNSSNFNKV